jgi:hypothetical protein
LKKSLLIIGALALALLSCGGPRVITLNYPIGLAQRYESRGTLLIDQKYFVDHRPAAERQNLTVLMGGDYLEYSQIQPMTGFIADAFITDFIHSGIFKVTSTDFDAEYTMKIKLVKCSDLQVEFQVVILNLARRRAVFSENIVKKINLEDPTVDLSDELLPMYQSAVIKMAVTDAIDKMANKIPRKNPGLPPAPPRRPSSPGN